MAELAGEGVLCFDDVNRRRHQPYCGVALTGVLVYCGPAMTLRSMKPGFSLLVMVLVGATGNCVRRWLPDGLEQRPIPDGRLGPPEM